MGRLPVVSGREAVRAFEAFGWEVVRQSSSHIIMARDGSAVSLSVPDHNEVAKGTPRALIRNAGLTVDEFAAAV